MKDTKQKTSSVAITFYVLAVLLLIVFVIMTWLEYDSIKQAMDSYSMDFSELWGQMWQSIANMFFTQSLPFLVYAFISYGIGYIVNQLALAKQPSGEMESVIIETETKDTKAEITQEQPQQESRIVQEEATSEEEAETKEQSDESAETDTTKEEAVQTPAAETDKETAA